MLIQLNHTGITSNPECGEAIGPSAVQVPSYASGGVEKIARAMTLDEIHTMQESFVAAAIRAQKAGDTSLSPLPFVKCFNCPRCQYGPFMPHKCPAEMKRCKN